MPKLIILQGEYDRDKLAELCKEHDACGGDVYDLIARHKDYSPDKCRLIGLSVAIRYFENHYNVVIHDRFDTNIDVGRYVRMADACGYDIEFVRLPTALGEKLTWEDCFAC